MALHTDESVNYGQTARAERGDMTVTVTDSGDVEAANREVITNKLNWSVYIREIVPDGTMVAKGQQILLFESDDLEDKIIEQEVRAKGAENLLLQSQENAAIKKKELDNSVVKAEAATQTAGDDLKRFEESDFPVKLNDAINAIKLAEQDLTLADAKLAFKLKANEDPDLKTPYSTSEIDADKLGVQRLRLALQKAQTQQATLEKYEKPQQLRKLGIAISDADLTLERARMERTSQLRILESEEAARKVEKNKEADKLAEFQKQQSELRVLAERDVMAVYDTGDRWSQFKVEVNAKVDPRKQIMILPDMSSLQVKTRVYESMRKYVKEGCLAYIHLDSNKDKRYRGHVSKIHPMPSQKEWFTPNVKVYTVEVQFDEPVEGLKPNMTAQVQLVAAQLKDVLTVPVAAVFTEGKDHYCYVLRDRKPSRTPVEIGMINEKRIQIVSGLDVNDEVLLTAPPEAPRPNVPEEPTTGPAPTGLAPDIQPKPAVPANGDQPAPTGPATTQPRGNRSSGDSTGTGTGTRPPRGPGGGRGRTP